MHRCAACQKAGVSSVPEILGSPSMPPEKHVTFLTEEVAESLMHHLPEVGIGTRIGLLGGSFDPPHVGHALLAQLLLLVGNVDRVWILPVVDHPFSKHSAPYFRRLAMVQETFKTFGNLAQVVEIEKYLPKPSYTVHTLEAIAALAPHLKLSLVIGSDIVSELHKWERPEDLNNFAKVVVVERKGHHLGPFAEAGETRVAGVTLERLPAGALLPEVSSTMIREAVQRERLEDLRGLLVPEVMASIEEWGLYRQ